MQTEATKKINRTIANNNLVMMTQSDILKFAKLQHGDMVYSKAFAQSAKPKINNIEFAAFDIAGKFIGLMPKRIEWTYEDDGAGAYARIKLREMREYRKQLEALAEAGLLPDIEAAFKLRYSSEEVAKIEDEANGANTSEAFIEFDIDNKSNDVMAYFAQLDINVYEYNCELMR